MQSEGPYKYVIESGDDLIVSSEGPESIVFFGHEAKDLFPDDICLNIANKAYEHGRKAERERCADICEQNATCEGIAQKIKAHILGGQDGK